MPDKTTLLLSLRPVIKTAPASVLAENFQNLTLRPILKLQDGLLVRVFKQYIHQRKDVFYKLSEADQRSYITRSLKQDQKFQQLLKGIIIGHFTDDEFDQFSSSEQEISRRISNLLEQRLISNITELKRIN
ncbi:glyoxalase [Dyadobacter sp. 3J3]|uniref:glyoxalase n=1 Tax=Dyadobacter sp. 3J3 TaxID=2606600 RepID=UPI0013590772|nr:glyoxalase [Dyadobacter sp. 3J3]